MTPLEPCPECAGTGQEWGSTDPDYREFWCGNCYGTGVVEQEDDR